MIIIANIDKEVNMPDTGKKLGVINIRCSDDWKRVRDQNRAALLPHLTLAEYIREMIERGEEYTHKEVEKDT